MEVIPHHGNIKDKQFGVPYMKQFDIVFNALDNVGEPTLPPSLPPSLLASPYPLRLPRGWRGLAQCSRGELRRLSSIVFSIVSLDSRVFSTD